MNFIFDLIGAYFRIKNPVTKFWRNAITILIVFSSYYYMEYNNGYSFFDNSITDYVNYNPGPQQLHNFRIAEGLRVYGFAIVLIAINFFIMISKQKQQQATYVQENSNGKDNAVNTSKTGKEKNKNDHNDIDPTNAIFKNKTNFLERYIRA